MRLRLMPLLAVVAIPATYEPSQLPFFRMLGTPVSDRKHVVFASSHTVPAEDNARETLAWFDKYLGLPPQKSQLPFFRMLGTPVSDRKHVVFASSHTVPAEDNARETLAWFDKYLGLPPQKP